MLHQTIAVDEQARGALAQAIEDAAADVGAWRQHRARLAELRLGSDARRIEIEHGDELLDRIKLIGRRVEMDAYQLIDLVVAGKNHPAFKPGTGSTSPRIRELQDAVTAAIAVETEACMEWNRARHAYGAARIARRAADAALAAYSARPLAVDQ